MIFEWYLVSADWAFRSGWQQWGNNPNIWSDRGARENFFPAVSIFD